MNGAETTLIAEDSQPFSTAVRFPVWPPDDQWLLASRTSVSGSTLMVLRSDVDGQDLDIDIDTPDQFRLQAVCFRDPGCPEPRLETVENQFPTGWIGS